MGPFPHCEKQPDLLIRIWTWSRARATSPRRYLTKASVSAWVGQVLPVVQTKTCRSYWPTRERGRARGRWPGAAAPAGAPSLEQLPHRDHPGDVVEEGEHHEEHEEGQADLLGNLALAHGQRASEHSLDGEEEEVAAVQHGHRQ